MNAFDESENWTFEQQYVFSLILCHFSLLVLFRSFFVRANIKNWKREIELCESLCHRIIKCISKDIEAYRERKRPTCSNITISIGHDFFALSFAGRKAKKFRGEWKISKTFLSMCKLAYALILSYRALIIHTGTQVNTATRNTMSIN